MPSRSWGANIELWTYRLFKNQTLYIEEILQRSLSAPTSSSSGDKNPVMGCGG